MFCPSDLLVGLVFGLGLQVRIYGNTVPFGVKRKRRFALPLLCLSSRHCGQPPRPIIPALMKTESGRIA